MFLNTSLDLNYKSILADICWHLNGNGINTIHHTIQQVLVNSIIEFQQ